MKEYVDKDWALGAANLKDSDGLKTKVIALEQHKSGKMSPWRAAGPVLPSIPMVWRLWFLLLEASS